MTTTEESPVRKKRRKDRIDPFHGVLPVNKPQGVTSHDVVNKIRHQFEFRKTGHGGTLDPQATGVLPILLGKGTKLSDKVMGSDKIYEGVMTLGIRTDSQDGDGEVIRTRDCLTLTREDITRVLKTFVGDIEQIPPMVSAIKKEGIPLYKLAREGKTVQRDPRNITITEIEILAFALPEVRFRVHCSKGTYVRTLCDDAGEKLGCGGHLSALCRIQTGHLNLDESHPLDDVLNWTTEELGRHIITLDKMAARFR